jgi:tungstate transport system substrate-binding protein
MALVGPPSDPAKVRGLGDIVEAFKRIAAKKSPFLLNGSDGGHYLVDVIWNAAGRPNKDGWFFDDGLKKEASVRLVETRHAYSIWGLTPFMRTEKEGHLDLEPLVLADPLLQRVLVCTLVKETKVPGVNAAAAKALQTYLLSPVTQAKIHATRHEGTRAMWIPAGRHNRSNFLPKD